MDLKKVRRGTILVNRRGDRGVLRKYRGTFTFVGADYRVGLFPNGTTSMRGVKSVYDIVSVEHVDLTGCCVGTRVKSRNGSVGRIGSRLRKSCLVELPNGVQYPVKYNGRIDGIRTPREHPQDIIKVLGPPGQSWYQVRDVCPRDADDLVLTRMRPERGSRRWIYYAVPARTLLNSPKSWWMPIPLLWTKQTIT